MDGKTHRAVAIPAGICISLFQSKGEPLVDRIIEAAGAGCGAPIGAIIPDRLDPLNNGPNHRSWVPSVSLTMAGGHLIRQKLSEAQQYLRAQSTAHAQEAKSATDPLVRIWHILCAWLCLFLAGCLAGFVVGYGSHLMLDAFTPRSLPLIC